MFLMGRHGMKFSKLSKRMIVSIAVLSVLLVAAAAVYHRSLSCLPFVYGVLLGSAAGVANVILLDRSVDRALVMGKRAAHGYVLLGSFLRLLLTGGLLVLSALAPALSLWGAVAGVLTYPIAIYGLKFSLKA
jgi:hypothetical protein